jgi:EmrB/QacA subfamily drug resistance transporter
MRTIPTLVAAYLGLFVGLIDSNAVNLALPAIRAEFGGGVSAAQWAADAYNVAFAAVLLTAGAAGDRFERRAVLRIGLALFAVASFGCAVAPHLGVLLTARAVQGVAAGIMLPQGLAIAAAAFPDAAGRAKATAAWAMAAASSIALGPVLGGVLTDTLGWRYIFWLNAPVCLTALALSYRYLPESRDPDSRQSDVPGQLLAMVSLATLTLVLVEGRSLGTGKTTALIAVVVIAGAAFLWWQRRTPEPAVPADLARNRQLAVGLGATFAMTFGVHSLMWLNSQAFQQQRGASALATALWFLPMPLTYLALIPMVNRVARRTGPRPPMVIGLTLMGAGILAYAAVGPDAHILLLATTFVLVGAGLAFNTGPAVTVVLSAVPVERSGLAAGLTNLARLLGVTMGIAVVGTVLASAGVRAALVVGGIVELGGALLAFHLRAKEACHA